ncbi:MAG: aminotransferase class III-fold pyridoxal phosphate-dependent enzyme [Candidatus Mariimomonas ferrooxydans]
MLDNCRRTGKYFIKKLEGLKKDFPSLIVEIRGLGFMIGMEITTTCDDIVNLCAKQGVLVNCTAGNVLRFTPPLIVSEKEINYLINVLEDVFGKIA